MIDYSSEGGWIAYNDKYGGMHDFTSPGENENGCSMYIAPSYDFDVDGPHYMNPPPLGAYVYFESSGEAKPLFTATASSVLTEPGEPDNKFAPGNLIDGTRSTAWAEGVDALGVGEWVELTAAVPVSIRGIKVWGGYAQSKATMKGNAHPIKLSVILDGDNEVGYIEFPSPSDSEYSDYFGEWRCDPDSRETKTNAETIRLTIKEVAPGAQWEDCCISEIEVW